MSDRKRSCPAVSHLWAQPPKSNRCAAGGCAEAAWRRGSEAPDQARARQPGIAPSPWARPGGLRAKPGLTRARESTRGAGAAPAEAWAAAPSGCGALDAGARARFSTAAASQLEAHGAVVDRHTLRYEVDACGGTVGMVHRGHVGAPEACILRCASTPCTGAAAPCTWGCHLGCHHHRHLDHTHRAYSARAYGRSVVRVELVVHEAADDRRLANRLVSDEDLAPHEQ